MREEIKKFVIAPASESLKREIDFDLLNFEEEQWEEQRLNELAEEKG